MKVWKRDYVRGESGRRCWFSRSGGAGWFGSLAHWSLFAPAADLIKGARSVAVTEPVARSSEELRSEIAQMGADLDALEGKLTLFDDKIADLAVAVYRKDTTAPGRFAQCRELRSRTIDEIAGLRTVRARVEMELSAALEREAAQARKVVADEAMKFAEDLGPLGDELDELFSQVRDKYQNLKRGLSSAERRGYGPNGATVQSLLADALRNALWRFTELKIESPHGRMGRSFSSLTMSWAEAARGGARRLLQPPAPWPKPNGTSAPKPVAAQPAADQNGRLIPRKRDISEPINDGIRDDPTFTIKG
jgi:hypothetical protein